MSITSILLAGGKSSRMGQDKGLLEIGGKKLIEIAISHISQVCQQILISSNSVVYSEFGYEVVPDLFPGIGPMGGIFSCLKKSTTHLNLVISVDLPFISTDFLAYLVKQAEGYQVAVPWSGNDHYEPLCACYNSSVLPLMEHFISIGNYKLPDLFRQLEINPLTIDDQLDFYHPGIFHNINTQSDLASARNSKFFI